MADVVSAFGDPVRYEQILDMLCDLALPPGHDVHPGRIPRLDEKFGVRDVLASAPGYAVVDHRHLPVIAQVDAPADPRPEGVADGQRHPRPATGVAHVAPVQ